MTQPTKATPTRAVYVQRTVLHCRSLHPDGFKNPRFRGKVHDAILGVLPFLARPTGRLLQDEGELREGHLPAYCSRCRLITEYEVVLPEEGAPKKAEAA